MSAYLVVAAAFKAVEGLLTQSLVGSIPIHSRRDNGATGPRAASADRGDPLSPALLLKDRAGFQRSSAGRLLEELEPE